VLRLQRLPSVGRQSLFLHAADLSLSCYLCTILSSHLVGDLLIESASRKSRKSFPPNPRFPSSRIHVRRRPSETAVRQKRQYLLTVTLFVILLFSVSPAFPCKICRPIQLLPGASMEVRSGTSLALTLYSGQPEKIFPRESGKREKKL
jgi:hypothetical protein